MIKLTVVHVDLRVLSASCAALCERVFIPQSRYQASLPPGWLIPEKAAMAFSLRRAWSAKRFLLETTRGSHHSEGTSGEESTSEATTSELALTDLVVLRGDGDLGVVSGLGLVSVEVDDWLHVGVGKLLELGRLGDGDKRKEKENGLHSLFCSPC